MTTAETTRHRRVPTNAIMASIAGTHDRWIGLLEEVLHVTMFVRGNEVTMVGDPAATERADRAVAELAELVTAGQALDEDVIRHAVEMLDADIQPVEVHRSPVLGGRRQVRAKTAGQKRYVDAILQHPVTFGIGPAGSGKSYLAVAAAVAALQAREVKRIVLTRPAVEAGERLGFLPGDLMAKVDPYLRPLYDALGDMLDPEQVIRMTERGAIEVAPLAYMRGRTLHDAFIILDEAQNTTSEQMKMFLTRLGFGSKMVITGDVTQIDVPGGRATSGLLTAQRVLEGVDEIAFCRLGRDDIVRHRVVQKIVDAYEIDDANLEKKNDTHE